MRDAPLGPLKTEDSVHIISAKKYISATLSPCHGCGAAACSLQLSQEFKALAIKPRTQPLLTNIPQQGYITDKTRW